MGRLRLLSAIAGALALGLPPSLADSAPEPNAFARFAQAGAVVLAVKTGFPAAGREVRLSVFDDPENFLEMAAIKHHAAVNSDGVAVIALHGLTPGDYAFVAYYDENGDGKLNRSAVGAPKEPLVFSNGVRPKLRKPTFEETKVDVAPGAVVVMTIEG